MTKTSTLLVGSTLALAAVMMTSPSAAQEVCDTNGSITASGTATSDDDLACGEGSTAEGGGASSGATAVGSFSSALGPRSTGAWVERRRRGG